MKWLLRLLGVLCFSLCVIILYHFLASFNAPERVFTLPDIGLFADTNCLKACWNDLKPGQTNVDKVFAVLQKEPYKNWKEVARFNDNYIMYSADNMSGFSVESIAKNDVLYRIGIGSKQLKLNLGDIITALGNPQYVLIDYDVGSEIMVLHAYVTLYYPDKGYVFSLRNSDGLRIQRVSGGLVSVCTDKNAVVSQVDVVQGGSIKDMLQELNTPYEKVTDSELELRINNLRHEFSFACLNLPYP